MHEESKTGGRSAARKAEVDLKEDEELLDRECDRTHAFGRDAELHEHGQIRRALRSQGDAPRWRTRVWKLEEGREVFHKERDFQYLCDPRLLLESDTFFDVLFAICRCDQLETANVVRAIQGGASIVVDEVGYLMVPGSDIVNELRG